MLVVFAAVTTQSVVEPTVTFWVPHDWVRVTAPEPALPTHYDLFRDIIGQAEGLPEDLAKNHNHYIRGGPKQ